MDVDLIFKRGMAYTIAAGTIAAVYFAAVGRYRRTVSPELPQRRPRRAGGSHRGHRRCCSIPSRTGCRSDLDKFFYRKRYDYRKTLIEFGRDLNSETRPGQDA